MKPNAFANKTRTELIGELEAMQMRIDEYRLLLDESSDPIFSFYPDGRYRYVNRAFADGVGRNREEIVGNSIWDVFSKEEADKRFALVRWVFENGETRNIEVCVARPDGDRFYLTTAKPLLDDQCRVLSVICISKDITERKAMEARLLRMAQHDPLTDLPNRTLFNDRLVSAIAQARREKSRLALLSIDLDRFKPVNDTFGHRVGDLLLQAVAKRLHDCLRESDSAGRVGGDEFLVLLPTIGEVDDALLVASKIQHALSQPFELPGVDSLSISSCLGIVIYPEHGFDEIELSKNADDALYRAKGHGRNRVHLFQAHDPFRAG